MDVNNINIDELLNKENTEQNSDNNKEETLEQRFSRERSEWTVKIQAMSAKMKDIFKVSELMTEIYTERQISVEYYHMLLTMLSKLNISYRKQWTEKYDFYSWKSQKRFPNEKTKELQILSEISDLTRKRELLDTHIKFTSATIGTIDNLIYGIKYKVEIEQISRGR